MPDNLEDGNHSPLPWRMEYEYSYGSGTWDVYGADGEYVLSAESVPGVVPSEADRNFILRAVNNHDALLAACRASLQAFEAIAHDFDRGYTNDESAAMFKCLDAIANVTKGGAECS